MKNILLILLACTFLIACNEKKKEPEKNIMEQNGNIVVLSSVQVKNAGIATGKMAQKEMSSLLKLNGKIDVPPQNMVSVSAPLGGYLKTTKLLPGMHVTKGEVIAVLEDQQYVQLQQDYLTAKSKISFLENEYQRQKALNQNKASSDKVYQLAEADYNGQKVLIASLQQKLELAGIKTAAISEANILKSVNIYSPINGYVSAVNVNIGKYVSPVDVLFELINPADIHLALKVFEKDLDKLFIGQKLVAFTNNQPDKKHPCEILLIGKDLSPDRNTDVHCHFEDYDKTLIPGTYMNAEIKVNSDTVLVLSSDAVVRFEGKQYVYKVIGENRFEMTEITTGISEDGFTQISVPDKSDLHTADYVIKGAYTLLMVMKNKEE